MCTSFSQLCVQLDEIPISDLDLKGEAGMKADQQGIARMKARQAQEEMKAQEKYEALKAMGQL